MSNAPQTSGLPSGRSPPRRSTIINTLARILTWLNPTVSQTPIFLVGFTVSDPPLGAMHLPLPGCKEALQSPAPGFLARSPAAKNDSVCSRSQFWRQITSTYSSRSCSQRCFESLTIQCCKNLKAWVLVCIKIKKHLLPQSRQRFFMLPMSKQKSCFWLQPRRPSLPTQAK